MHLAAFPKSSLGFTILGPKENIKSLTREQMVEFRDTFYTAPNMILVGVGNVDHEQLVHLGQKYFGKVPSEPVSGLSNEIEPARYIGSETRIWDSNMKNLYSAIGFKGPSLHSADMLAVNLIQILLGIY
jgi:processing peptidase subunit beta